jgi:organic hydroperoxide reductase OsmC/OhrA
MPESEVAAALERARRVFLRRPEAGVHEDSAATARWGGGVRVITAHPNGTRIESDMPGEFGGTGDRITPGWLFRAGLAACSTTSIAMAAAVGGIALELLEVQVTSRSDALGMLGMNGADGQAVAATPGDLRLSVRIGARGASATQLRELVATGCRQSPIPCAVQSALPLVIDIHVEVPA